MKSTAKFLVTLLCAIALLNSKNTLAQNSKENITGIWITETKDEVEIYKKGDAYFGKIVKLANPTDENGKEWTDQLNTNPTLKSRKIVGIDVLSNLRYEGKGEWEDGKIYVPEEGKSYNSKMELKKDGTLEVSGCVSFFCDSEIWKRKK